MPMSLSVNFQSMPMKMLISLLLLTCQLSFAADLGAKPKFLVKSVDGDTDFDELPVNNTKILPAHRKIAYH